MKKLIALLLILSLVFCFASCAGISVKVDTDNDTDAELVTDDIDDDEEYVPSPADMLMEKFEEIVTESPDSSTDDIAMKLIESDIIPLTMVPMPVEPGLLNGFDEEITGFTKGTQFAPMIGSIPFIGYVFELDGTMDDGEFMEMLNDKCNTRWNVCTEADETSIRIVENKAVFVMSPSNFDD